MAHAITVIIAPNDKASTRERVASFLRNEEWYSVAELFSFTGRDCLPAEWRTGRGECMKARLTREKINVVVIGNL